jgi:hypothetical protein
MQYEIVKTRKLVNDAEIQAVGGDIGVVVKLADGRMAAGFAYIKENAVLIAVKKASEI